MFIFIINIEIERIRFGQVFNSKGNFVGIDRTLLFQSDSIATNTRNAKPATSAAFVKICRQLNTLSLVQRV